MLNLITYLTYLIVSLLITFRVGALLSQNGAVFLNNQTGGNKQLASSINNLLLIGYYLINIGYILLVLNLNDFRLYEDSNGVDNQLYFLTRNLGLVTLMLGAMHMMLLYVLANWRPARAHQANQE